jgi:hypothetical protein
MPPEFPRPRSETSSEDPFSISLESSSEASSEAPSEAPFDAPSEPPSEAPVQISTGLNSGTPTEAPIILQRARPTCGRCGQLGHRSTNRACPLRQAPAGPPTGLPSEASVELPAEPPAEPPANPPADPPTQTSEAGANPYAIYESYVNARNA